MLCISINLSYTHVPSCYLEFWKLQKRICRNVGPSLAASLEPLVHRQNLASLSLFYRYYFERCFSELAQMVPLPFSRGRSTPYSNRLHDFSVIIRRCYKNVYVNNFFPRTGRLWNSLPMKCFPLTYDLRARLHETRSELKPVWNLKPLWNVVPFTWQFTWRFHWGNFLNNGKALIHMCKWYLLIIANLINLTET